MGSWRYLGIVEPRVLSCRLQSDTSDHVVVALSIKQCCAGVWDWSAAAFDCTSPLGLDMAGINAVRVPELVGMLECTSRPCALIRSGASER